MKVFLFRHGDSGEFFHAPGMKDPDPGLSAVGRETTAAMAKKLKEMGEEPTIVYTSKLARARQTGQIVAKEFGLGPVKQEDGLGPTDHKGPTLTMVFKKLAAQKDPRLTKVVIVSHHDQIRNSLADLNFEDTDDVDPIAKSEFRILDVDRDGASWEELDRCVPSDLDGDYQDLY